MKNKSNFPDKTDIMVMPIQVRWNVKHGLQLKGFRSKNGLKSGSFKGNDSPKTNDVIITKIVSANIVIESI